MTGMVERVARAICKSQTQGEGFWKAFLPEARAAIAAMREPTEGVVSDMTSVVIGFISDGEDEDNNYLDDNAAREVFAAAIDAALEEKP